MDAKIALFKKWLHDNGAVFSKIEWPSVDTVGGCRGAQAIDDISPEEHMIEIPIQLMMSPPIALADTVIGPILRLHEEALRGDLLLSLFIMFEMSKGPQSFYFPYLEILPEPGCVSQWTDMQLQQLQNENLMLKSKNRLSMLRNSYNRSILPLCNRYPEQLPVKKFSYDSFLFAWYSVQARAFGRRLPWTAMVPFADCLNHSNLQTKYDYNVGDNGLFRLFPSGSNCYPRGCEVFNSYGRRQNDNLLLDYGFAILENEWDQVEIILLLERTVPDFDRKRTILYTQFGLHHHTILTLQWSKFPFEALAFLRVQSMNLEEINVFQDEDAELLLMRHSGGGKQTGDDVSAAMMRIASVRCELQAMRLFIDQLLGLVSKWPTSVREDEEALEQLSHASSSSNGDTADDHWRAVCAITYRLTRKRIIDAIISKLRALEEHLLSPENSNYDKLLQQVVSTFPPTQGPNLQDLEKYVRKLCI